MSNDWHIEMSMIVRGPRPRPSLFCFIFGFSVFNSAHCFASRIVQCVPIIRNKLDVFVEYAWRPLDAAQIADLPTVRQAARQAEHLTLISINLSPTSQHHLADDIHYARVQIKYAKNMLQIHLSTVFVKGRLPCLLSRTENGLKRLLPGLSVLSNWILKLANFQGCN